MPLKPYIGYSRRDEFEENGTVLIFAHTVQEARKVGWDDLITDEWIDFTARLAEPFMMVEADPKMVEQDKAHVNWNPKVCRECEHYGQSVIGEDGLCDECRDNNDYEKRMGKGGDA